jgi:hypothetical protein
MSAFRQVSDPIEYSVPGTLFEIVAGMMTWTFVSTLLSQTKRKKGVHSAAAEMLAIYVSAFRAPSLQNLARIPSG